MPPGQLEDVPVPQVPERPGRRELHEVLRRLHEVEEATRWREQNALLEREEVDEDEDEEEEEDDEEEEISRFPPHFPSTSLVSVLARWQHLPSWMALHLGTP